ncbi:serine/threonine protein kinase [Streptomycetaceae bacterium NBC_01309]
MLKGDPHRVGPYRIVGRLGAGGMGVVFAGVDCRGGRAAVKLVHEDLIADAVFRARFVREVDILARVTGPYLAPLLGADISASTPWLATVYIPGPTLQSHVASGRHLSGAHLDAFACGTAAALSAIHEAGVTHRDFKPANVILSPTGPRVLDFGIAHTADDTAITRTGAWTGTPGWTAPEQYQGHPGGPKADIFTWAMTVAYAATGSHPFGTGPPDVLAYRVMSEPPNLTGLAAELREALTYALDKDPSQRPTALDLYAATASSLSDAPTAVLDDDRTMVLDRTQMAITRVWDFPADIDSSWEVTAASGPRRRRNLAAATTAAVLAAAAAGGLTYFALQAGRDAHQQQAENIGATQASPTVGVQPTGAPETTTPASASSSATASPSLIPVTAVATPTTFRTSARPPYAEPQSEYFLAAHPAATAAERRIEAAISQEVPAVWNFDFEVTFDPERDGVFLTSASIGNAHYPGLDDEMRRVGAVLCTVLKDELKADPNGPYDRYFFGIDQNPGQLMIIEFGRGSDCQNTI